MGTALKLMTVRGIDIRVHITFPLILLWAAWQFSRGGAGTTGAIFGVIVVILLFVVVTLHELGHSTAAQFYDIPVKDITLLPIGGVAQLERMPEQPWREFVVAIAGPAVNFGLALILYPVALALDIAIVNPLNLAPVLRLENIFVYVFVQNLFLGVFNLIPAFPMDGGRVLRALLATQLPYAQATRIAATVGQGMAWLLGLWGFLGGGIGLILIAFFIYMGAGQESAAVQLRSRLRGITVGQVYSRPVYTLPPEATVQAAVDLTLTGFQTSFPVCSADNLLGVVTYQKLLDTLKQAGSGAEIQRAMVADVPVVSPATELFEAQQLLAQSRSDALPVVEDGHFLGLVTAHDVNEAFRLASVDPDLISNLRPVSERRVAL